MNKKYFKPEVEFISIEDVMRASNICPSGYKGDEGDNTYTLNCNWGLNC